MEATKLLENQIAIVTGAASGIGKEIALEFAREGALVVIADINQEKSDFTIGEVKKLSPNSLSIPTDIAQEKTITNLVNQVKNQFGRVDILINNAGIGMDGTPLNINREGWGKVLETNLTGSFFLTQKVSKFMVETKTKGKIIFITSIHQDVISKHAQYSASKAALKMVVKEFAMELAPFEIRVNGIAPGAIRSREEMSVEYEPTPLLHQRGIPLDVARIALILTTDYFSRYMTGSIVKVDGGLSLLPPGYRNP